MEAIAAIIMIGVGAFIGIFLSIFIITEGVRRGMRKARAEERAELAEMEAFEDDEQTR